jgi:hypothetical protein
MNVHHEITSAPVVSIVCVFNDALVFEQCLHQSLLNQDHPYELIPVDNRANAFRSATEALNAGARKASGEYVIFAHQDVVFLDKSSLGRFLRSVQSIDGALGWCGIAGRDRKGFWRGILRDRDFISGEPFDSHLEVQTLDELLLCRRRDQHCFFDESLDGWHAYGVDACCDAIRRGEKNYVIETSLWHASKALNTAKLRESHKFIYGKHYAAIGSIMTTCGRIPRAYEWKGGYRYKNWVQKIRWMIARTQQKVRAEIHQVELLNDLLDRITIDRESIACLRGKFWVPRMEAVGFRDKTIKPRRIVHHFEPESLEDECWDTLIYFPDSSTDRLVVDSKWLDKTIKILEVGPGTNKKNSRDFSNGRAFQAEGLDGRMYFVGLPSGWFSRTSPS